MARLLKPSPNQLRNLLQICRGTLQSQPPKTGILPHGRALSRTTDFKRQGSGQKDEYNVGPKNNKDYSPTKRYTSTPMVEEDAAEGRMDETDEASEAGPVGEQTFGQVSNKFKHKFKPLGTDLIEELEEAELGDDWVKPEVKRHTPIYYGNQMKKLVREGKLPEAIEMLEVTMLKEAKVFPTEFNYNVLIGACGRAGYTDKAFKLFNRMKERGLQPSSVTYTSLFNACSQSPWAKTDGLTRLRKLHQQLLEKSIKVNLITHHSMMKAYAKCGDLEMTFKLFRHLLDAGVQLMPKSFSFLFFACAEDKESGFLYAVEAWRQMLKQGIKPDVYIYNLLLRTTRDCGIGDMETANRVLLRSTPIEADRTQALEEGTNGQSRRMGKREKLLGRTREVVPLSGKKAELVVLEPLPVKADFEEEISEASSEDPWLDDRIDEEKRETAALQDRTRHEMTPPQEKEVICHVPTTGGSHWWEADVAATEIPKSPGSVDNCEGNLTTVTVPVPVDVQLAPAATFHPSEVPNLLDISADMSNVQSLAAVSMPSDRLALLGGMQGFLENMKCNDSRPDVKGLSILAEILPANKQEENHLLNYVMDEGIKVDIDFYNVFIRRGTRRKDLKGAKNILVHVREQKLYPNLRTYVNLAAGCAKPEEGFQLLQEMEESGVRPTGHLYGALIGATQRHRNFPYLMDVLRHMEKTGVKAMRGSSRSWSALPALEWTRLKKIRKPIDQSRRKSESVPEASTLCG
ncbi:pentatricopeptide repeat-containing protein 1, mitochondrial-like [Diadema setosum]|uniref:pentatricopeptide repeat-containing protein 1, mitochondrial-like n=1 Tax=Diadema setosum TaxID=31175 RepID=UPI003B3AEA18